MAKSWQVFEPGDAAPDTLVAADKAVFVKDGFSVGAFLIAPVWLLWRRMWLVFLAWLAARIALSGLGAAFHFSGTMTTVLTLLFACGFALEANQLRAWTLRGKGWRFAGIACGQDLIEAEHRHLEGRGLNSAPPAELTIGAPIGNANVGRDFFGPMQGHSS